MRIKTEDEDETRAHRVATGQVGIKKRGAGMRWGDTETKGEIENCLKVKIILKTSNEKLEGN